MPQVHQVTRQVEYRGDLVSLTEALVGFPSGGQILMSGATYQQIYGRLHTVSFKDHTIKGLQLPTLKQPVKAPGNLLWHATWLLTLQAPNQGSVSAAAAVLKHVQVCCKQCSSQQCCADSHAMLSALCVKCAHCVKCLRPLLP